LNLIRQLSVTVRQALATHARLKPTTGVPHRRRTNGAVQPDAFRQLYSCTVGLLRQLYSCTGSLKA